MSDNVVDMSGKPSSKSGKPIKEIVELLETLLDEAKQGQIQHFAFVTIDVNGIPSDGYVPGGSVPDLVTVVGGLELCKASLVNEMISNDQEPE